LNWKGDRKSSQRDSHENSDRIIPLNVSSYEQNINVDANSPASSNNDTNDKSDEAQTFSANNGYIKKHHKSSKRLKSGNDTFESLAKIETVKEESQSSDSNQLQNIDNDNNPYKEKMDDKNGLSEQNRNAIEGAVAKIISKALSGQKGKENTVTELSVESIVHSNYYAEQLILQANNRLNTNPISATLESASSDALQSPLSFTQTGYTDSETMNTPQYLKTQEINFDRAFFPNNMESSTNYFNSVPDLQQDTESNGNNNKRPKSRESESIHINSNSKNSDDVCLIS
jgi:hypothetical protein